MKEEVEAILEKITDDYPDRCTAQGCGACQYYKLLNPSKIAEYLLDLSEKIKNPPPN